MKAILGTLLGAAMALTVGLASAAPNVWVIDDGEKIKRDATSLPLATGAGNPVWSPGKPIALFGLRNETVAFQVVVGADTTALDGVTVELDALTGPSGATIKNDAGATDPTKFVGRNIERFVENFFDIKRASGGSNPLESLGWVSGSGPAPGTYLGFEPDALIPIEVAPTWAPYPMKIAANQNGIVWIDVSIGKAQPIGKYTGIVVVKSSSATLATIPLELEVASPVLPDRPIETMLYYDRSELDRRIGGGDAAELHLWQLLHRHRLTAMHGAMKASDLDARLTSALDGSAYTNAKGYDGPGVSLGDGLLSLGTYGGYGAPSTSTLADVAGVADAMASKGLLSTTDVFVYAIDEDCSSPYGKSWMDLRNGSSDANVKKVRIGWTCSTDVTVQPVDLVIQFSADFNPAKTATARAAGKKVWVYNGARPQTGSFLTDDDAISLRANGWISAMNDTGRWFYWETTFWYDDNRGGKGAYDPFTTPETFHNTSGDYCEGDGVLVYPGKQIDVFTDHSVGLNGVIASIRLKNFRRGAEDAGYLQLARAVDAAKTDAIAKGLIPKALAGSSGKPSWASAGKPWFDARKALYDLLPKDAPPPPGDSGVIDGGPTSDSGGPIVDDSGSPISGDSSPIGDDGGLTNGDSGGGSSGCGCRASSSDSPQGALVVAFGIAMLVVRRKRARAERD